MEMRGSICLCCKSEDSHFCWGVLSPFLARRAFEDDPSPVKIHTCSACGFRWSERGLTDDEVIRLYRGYRGDAYFAERHSFEPWYSRVINDGIGSDKEMVSRRETLLDALKACGFDPDSSFAAADHGGDRGQMLMGFPNATKRVFDLSGVDLEHGCEQIERVEDENGRFDLVLNCHVLEHLNDPEAGLREVMSLARKDGLIYVELPNEPWKPAWQPRFQNRFLRWITRHRLLLKTADFLCTGMRTKTNRMPPMGFVAIREHLQYYSLSSIETLMRKCGLDVLLTRQTGNYLLAVGRKSY